MLSVPGAAQTEQLKHSLKTSGRLRMGLRSHMRCNHTKYCREQKSTSIVSFAAIA